MTDSNQAAAPAHVTLTIKRHHFRWGVMAIVILVGAAVIGAFYAGGGKVPNLPTFTGLAQNEQAQNGESQQTTDRFGPDGKLQRTETQTVRYDPLDKLTAAITATTQNVDNATAAMKKSSAETNDSVKVLTGQVKDLGGKIDGIAGNVSALGDRVTKLETQPVAPAPAPMAAPAPAPTTVPAPAPKTGPQASAEASADTDIVLPKHFLVTSVGDDANQAKMQSCKGRLVPDLTAKPKTDGSLDKSGKPIKFYPNRCES
jgi:hypothetical protein